ncbi:DUF4309 domain-containing protein [Paenibacillus abyssi]|uniref:DUF4309 domain-containing protein n=2 Tax=Paenibacillus abyssi TaxID=1340531 RepID=A0A917CEW0_9BACL|nr:DUF4309 domain-containing protein [Paenibacillus abyssi]GGF86766.1 hypothetical protein GCM10010916_00100 [Paenibacillus abyssi]
MKWRSLAITSAMLAALLSACSSEPPSEDQTQNVNTVNIENNDSAPAVDPANEQGEGETDAGQSTDRFPAGAYEGKVEGIAYGLGDLTEGITEELGEPDQMDYFAGGVYLSYPNVVFFSDAELDGENNIVDGTIKGMGFGTDNSLFGVTIGQPFEEIAVVLGDGYTMHTPDENVNNEFYAGMWSMEYRVGEYAVIFTAEEENGPTNAAYYEET